MAEEPHRPNLLLILAQITLATERYIHSAVCTLFIFLPTVFYKLHQLNLFTLCKVQVFLFLCSPYRYNGKESPLLNAHSGKEGIKFFQSLYVSFVDAGNNIKIKPFVCCCNLYCIECLVKTLRISSHPVVIFLCSVQAYSQRLKAGIHQFFMHLFRVEKSVGYHTPIETSLLYGLSNLQNIRP